MLSLFWAVYVNYRGRFEKSISCLTAFEMPSALLHFAPMQLPLLKMSAAGNRILVADARNVKRHPPTADSLRELAGQQSFDQLMWVTDAADDGDDAAYRVFNADGSEVEQCGNGIRCVAWMLARDASDKGAFKLASPAGPIEARVAGDDRFAVDMGHPVFAPARIPFKAESEALAYSLDVGDQSLDVAVLSMGNPHCVVFVDDINSGVVEELGPLIEHHPRFPARTNAGFASVRDRETIDLRVHERGVGETLACGTGACAAAVAAQRHGAVESTVSVHLPGGQLVVSWRRDTVWLTGGAELVSQGSLNI